jgi:hypothetical protein
MSLDSLQLTKPVLRILFGRTLVETAQNQLVKNNAEASDIPSLGDNQRNILLLASNEENTFPAGKEMELLTNLLGACRLSMSDIALVNYGDVPCSYQDLSDRFNPEKVLIFGVTTTVLGLPFTIPHFQIQSFNGQSYLTVPRIRDFLDNPSLKKELWTSLKKLFLLSS